MSKSQVFVAHSSDSFWVICRNVSRTFAELCKETPYWCIVLVHQYGRRKSTKTNWSSLFLWKLFLFTRELAYVRIHTSSNTWSGYTAENQEERLFSTRLSTPILWKFGSSNCCIFEMKHAMEIETCTKIYFLLSST